MKKFCIYIFFIIVSGILIGKISGDYIQYSIIRGNITILSFAFSPSRGFVDIYSLLNSSDDYKRLAGYYAYRDSGLVDLDFLLERYKAEDSDIIKKAIIWASEEYKHKEKLVDFYWKLYNISPAAIQKILLVKTGDKKNQGDKYEKY